MLAIDDVHAYYGDSHVLHGVSLQIEPGKVTSLLGRNGAGKTTTLLTVMGFLTPREGRVTFMGQDISGMAPHRISRRGVGLVPQERGIFPSLSVEENLLVAARGAHSGKGSDWQLDRIYKVFPRLAERKGNMGFQLSGGEQQLLSIGRALMLNPTYLLMDEPSEGLAPLIVHEIVEVVKEVRAQGMGVLLIEQNLSVALDLGDVHYVLSKGHVCFRGDSKTLAHDEAVLSTHLSV